MIRDAFNADTEALINLLGAIEAAKTVGRSPAEVRARLERALPAAVAAKETIVLLSIGNDHSINGYCSVHIVPFLILAGPEAYLTELFIHPNARGLGIGTKLLEEAQKRAQQRGCSRLSLLNDRSIESYRRGFYAKHGWAQREDMANFVFPLNKTPK
jgi:ribosomal protein S18 acetylase RimI-like enzyme